MLNLSAEEVTPPVHRPAGDPPPGTMSPHESQDGPPPAPPPPPVPVEEDDEDADEDDDEEADEDEDDDEEDEDEEDDDDTDAPPNPPPVLDELVVAPPWPTVTAALPGLPSSSSGFSVLPGPGSSALDGPAPTS